MKKFNPNKNIIITLIIVILVVSVLSVTIARRAVGNSSSFVQSAVNDKKSDRKSGSAGMMRLLDQMKITSEKSNH